MRRLRNSRSPDPDELALEGFDRSDLEGEAIGPVADEIPWLRPFGADIPGPLLPDSAFADEPEGERILRQARELAGIGRRVEAVLLLRQSLQDELVPLSARALLAELLERGGDTEAALQELGLALESADDPIPLLVRRGEMLARVGQPAEAERDLREAVRQRPGYPAAHFQLGMVLLRRGRPAEAAEELGEALRFAPDDPAAHYHLGEALEAQGELQPALHSLERAVQLCGGTALEVSISGRAYQLMGRLLDRLGRSDEAMAMHRKAREASIR